MIVGIDLGTTNSLVGVFRDEGPQLIPNALGSVLTPSAVSVDAQGAIIVGQAARDRLVSHPEASVATFKRWMGSPRETVLGNRRFRPEDLSALVIRSLLQDAEAFLGTKVTEAVISVPAYFGDAQRKATRIAGELAGIKVERLINEPTAAALAYGLEQRVDGSTFIVLDLGGGTFDVSILEIFEGVMQVHASCGDNHLGGEDFLRMLVETCCRDLGVDPQKLPRQELAHVHSRLEQLKRRLAHGSEGATELNLGGKALEWRITEERFAEVCDPLLQRVRAPIERAMRDSRLTPSQLQEIVLVGGASRMPMLNRLVARMMGRLPLRHVNPDEAIAQGACVAAGLKARDRTLEEVVLTDVCPYTLGVEISREDEYGGRQAGHFSPILTRNATVPVSRVESYYPVQDGQREILLNVYQGESPLVANNVRLGELKVVLPPRLTREEGEVEVRFTYDINGVLQVEATVAKTGQRHELVLQNNAGVLDPEQVRQRLKALESIKIHPRKDQENLALVARAERLFEESLQHRAVVQQWLVNFMGVLDTQDPALIREHRRGLAEALDRIEADLGA
jgi:molecular chaperone HscC